ncbi:lysophospholipid acyltransferase family protein [Pseudodesulfovibrio senegalensis]|uniref:Lysophospholipid acyltransferase family protein n=1 Tax=Pseudodesulfovibrio senegalensis TaxID=1721087 RepID=A0A6N6N4L7_9BACT|nr:GNAT family N-acyltransferase [Pseudodesulfovibrio senegalensis]KAB1443014.1 lysophospholipid acyltransferase family protein [Pseudodesulfovibrio senegalensis]
MQRQEEIFRIDSPYGDPWRSALFSMVSKPLSRVLRFKTLNTMYARAGELEGDFIDRALNAIGIRFELDGQPLSRIPANGPLMVVANHPFGAVEGLLLVKLLRQIRPDVRIMANYMLSMIPEMREHLIAVDPFGTSGSVKSNISGLKESMRWLRNGGLLGVFPAGEVSSLRVRKRMVADPDWSPTVAGIARKTGASVLPVFFQGRNSALFQAAGMLHPRLRTVLLPHENLKHSKAPVRIAVGSVIPPEKMASFDNDREAVRYLRFRTHVLRKRPAKKILPTKAPARTLEPLANSRPRHILASEVAALPDSNILLESGCFTVFAAQAKRIPRLMREIGVLREKTFRAVGEGTGKPMDIDAYDDYYHHLVLWNHEEREVAGAYRFARADKVLAEHGIRGLYSASLFDFEPGVIETMQPALEMGRSFITENYQRSYQPLLLLWKGIAAYVTRHPQYTNLFGCVSVSGDYSHLSHELIAGFLKRHCSLEELAGQVHPKLPPRTKRLKRLDIDVPELAFSDPADINALVTDVESGKSIPVLLKQYLKLGGKLLGFNVDPEFGNCMDGLILVDLKKTDAKILRRFMGKAEADNFMALHHATVAPLQPAA